jgi:nucleoside-diphosphate-sugar epimerase
MAAVIVTGATGLIGRRLVPQLSEAGHEVHVLGRRAPLSAVAGFLPIDLLRENDRLGRLLGAIGATHAIHLAWYAEPGKFWSAPENLDWLAASLTFARAFAAAGGRRLVTAGTCAEYDWTGSGRLDEFTTPTVPATGYGAAKLALGTALAAHAGVLGLSIATARIFFPFAADERPERLFGP